MNIVILQPKLELGREDLEKTGIDVDQGLAAESRQERRMDRAGEVPQQIGAAHDVVDPRRRPSIDRGPLQVLSLDIVENQNRGMPRKSIGTEAREKIIGKLGVARAIARGLHQLEPEDVVAKAHAGPADIEASTPRSLRQADSWPAYD